MVILISCALSVRPPTSPEEKKGLDIELSAYPQQVDADTSKHSLIWATVKREGKPAPDSLRVFFVTTLGKIDSVSTTVDGLAMATLRSNGTPGGAVVAAQIKTIRDSVLVYFVIR